VKDPALTRARAAIVVLAGLFAVSLGAERLLGAPADAASTAYLWFRGARVTAAAAAWVFASTSVVALAVGGLAGLGPRPVDTVLSRAMEIAGALPSIVLVVVLRALTSSDVLAVATALAILKGLEGARSARTRARGIAREDFVLAARALGASEFRVFRSHVVPHLIAPVLSHAASAAAAFVALDAAVSYVGLGAASTGFGALLAREAGSAPGAALAAAAGVAALLVPFLVVEAALDPARKLGRRFV